MKTLIFSLALTTLTGCLPLGAPRSELEFDPGAVSGDVSQTGEERRIPTFEALKSRLLVSKCLGCHEDMSEEIALAKLVIPGDAEGSKLFQVLKDGSMPMGGAPVSTEELEFVRAYIEALPQPEP